MPSGAVLVTSITSFIGFLLNSTSMALVLSRGRKIYHYLFSGFLFICALWDLGIFLSMIRNSHVNELPIYGWYNLVAVHFYVCHSLSFYLQLSQPAEEEADHFYLGIFCHWFYSCLYLA